MKIAAFDCGQHTGLVIVDETEGKLRLEHRATIEVGKLIELKKPKVWTLPDGSTRTQTHKTWIDDEDCAALYDKVKNLLALMGIERVVIERVQHVYFDPTWGTVKCAAIATGVAQAQLVVGEIMGAARSLGIPVASCITAAWRSRVVGKVVKDSGRENLGPVLVERIEGWSEEWGDGGGQQDLSHERDAAGLAIWDMDKRRDPPEVGPAPKRKRQPATKKPPKTCACKRKHVKTCVFFVKKPPRPMIGPRRPPKPKPRKPPRTCGCGPYTHKEYCSEGLGSPRGIRACGCSAAGAHRAICAERKEKKSA